MRDGSNKFRQFLFDPQLPLWRYCLLAFPVFTLPAMAISGAARGLFTLAGVDLDLIAPPSHDLTIIYIFGLIVFSPIVETLLLALGIRILSALSPNTFFVAISSALIWGGLHDAFGLLWFFGPAWGFFVMSCGYIAWRRQSFKSAYLAASIPHAFNNSFAAFVILLWP